MELKSKDMTRDVSSSNRTNSFKVTRIKLRHETPDGKERGETELLEPTAATTFWSVIWSERVSHNSKASWLKDPEQESITSETHQEHRMIAVENIRNGVNNMANC